MLNYASMKISPNEEIYNEWIQKFTSKTKAKDIHDTIWLHEKLSISPSKNFMSKWVEKAINALNTMEQKEVLGSLWALSFLQNIGKIDEDIDLNDIKAALLNKIDISILSGFGADIKHKLLTTDYMNEGCILTPEQRQNIIDQQRTKNPTHSGLQTKAFKKLFPTPEEKSTLTEEAFIEELGLHVDGYVAAKNLIIQIDGNTHYTNNFSGEPCLTFQTQLNSKLLESLGYKVIRISTYEIGEKGWEISYKEQIAAAPYIEDNSMLEVTDYETSDSSSYDGDIDKVLSILSETEVIGATPCPLELYDIS